jgi:hypothetical protein
MKRYVTTADAFALLLPALAAVAGTWHLAYNHNGNPLGRTATDLSLFYATFLGGYLFWGAIARATGASSVAAITGALFLLGMLSSISIIGVLIVPAVAIPSFGGLLAALAWASRRRDADWSIPPPVRAPATDGDAVAIVLPAIFVIAAIIAYRNTGSAPVTALRPWAVIAEYIAYFGGLGFVLFLQRRAARRFVVPCALIAVTCAVFGSTTIVGVFVLIFVGMPAAGAAVAGLLAELSSDDDAPSPA